VQDETVCALTKASGVTSLDQWFTAKKPVKLGGEAPGANDSDVPRMLQATLKLPLQLIGLQRHFVHHASRGNGESTAAAGPDIDRSTWKGIDSGEVVDRPINAKTHDISRYQRLVTPKPRSKSAARAGVHAPSAIRAPCRRAQDRLNILREALAQP
jgi:hypothetical protein